MIQFFINFKTFEAPEWHELILPDNFSFTSTEDNPEITTDGEYTLDITVSLLEMKNVIALNFINRLNNSKINRIANAQSIDNGKVRYGTILIQKNSDIDVTFQFLSGNSELKYILTKDTRKIWELDWGTESAIDFNRALRSIEASGYGVFPENVNGEFTTFYQNNYVCAPLLVGTVTYNKYLLTVGDDATTITGVQDIVMQPYILYFINKFPELLGYTLKYNQLMFDEIALKMYLVNPIKSLKYSDALPDMTILEFKNAIEDFYNVEFKVDSTNKTISINSAPIEIQNKKVVSVLKYLDSYNRDMSSDLKSNYQSVKSIGYSHTTSKFFAYHDISTDELKNFTITECATLSDILVAAGACPYDVKNWFVLFKDLSMGDYYLVSDLSTVSIDHAPYFNHLFMANSSLHGLILINKFREVIEDTSSDKLELKITPAAFSSAKQNGFWAGTELGSDIYIQFPVSSRVPEKTVTQNIFESIENGTILLQRIDYIEVALYTGRIQPFENNSIENATFTYPFSHIDKLPEFYSYVTSQTIIDRWVNSHFSINATETLRLYGMDGIKERYHNHYLLDTSKEYTFSLIDGPDITANNIFVINNKKYLPISLEREKTRTQNTVLLKCYEMLV